MHSFLSCLSGSEPYLLIRPVSGLFLSCLSGSERGVPVALAVRIFLSCLSGSEPEPVDQIH